MSRPSEGSLRAAGPWVSGSLRWLPSRRRTGGFRGRLAVASPFVLAFVVVGLGCWVLDPAALSVVVDVLSGDVPVSGGRRLGLGFGAFSLFSSLPVGLPPLPVKLLPDFSAPATFLAIGKSPEDFVFGFFWRD